MPEESKKLSLKEITELEIAKCEKDPVYFIMRYVYIQTEESREIFNLYDFQKKVARLFTNEKYKRISILKSRQIGITTLCAAYSLWYILFHGDRFVMCLAPTQKKAKIILDKVKFAYEQLPGWVKKRYGHVLKNELTFSLKNGSQISAASGDSDDARGFTAHILFIDEAAYIENAEDLWGAAQSTLNTTNGLAVILSTPNGAGGWFYDKHTEAKEKAPQTDLEKKRTFVPVDLPWHVHPHHDQEWRDFQDKEMGKRLARQECDCSFIASGDTCLDPETIEWYEKNYQEAPIETRGPLKDLWIFRHAIPGEEYAVIVDVARGDGSDYSTIDVYHLASSEQVAEYKGQPDTKDFPDIILSVCHDYHKPLLIIERESMGWGVVKDVLETKYDNLYFSPKEGMVMDADTYANRNYDYDREKMTPGFSTNVKFRPLIVDSFTSIIEKKQLIVHSMRSINEWRTFVWTKEGKAKAQKGFNDDLTIPKGIYAFLRDTAIRWSKTSQQRQAKTLESYVMTRMQTQERTKQVTVSNTQTESTNQYRQVQKQPQKNPFHYNVGRGRVDDCSWLV